MHDSRVALLVDDRVHHLLAPPRTRYPYITFQIISQDRKRHMANICGLVEASVQINVWGRSASSAYDTAEAVRRSLDHLNHRTIGRAPNSETIRAAFLMNSFDDYGPSQHAEEMGIFGMVQEWTIWHEESLPALAV
jgi:hypothetical protein